MMPFNGENGTFGPVKSAAEKWRTSSRSVSTGRRAFILAGRALCDGGGDHRWLSLRANRNESARLDLSSFLAEGATTR
jgi:hypothetical protein